MVLNYSQKLFAGALSLIFTIGFATPAFAGSEISWNTDSHDYYLRDTIQVWGSVFPLQGDEMIIEIKNSNGENVFSSTADVDSNGQFEADIPLFGDWQPYGQFSVNLTHGDETSWMPIWIFQSESTAPEYIESTIFFDKSTYALTEVVTFWIISPDFDEDGLKKETIGEKNRGELEIKTGMGRLEPYILEETNTGSGVFMGKITLTGDKNLDVDESTNLDAMTSKKGGKGPENGELGAYKSDKIEVTFSNEFEEVSKTAEISWSLAVLEVETDSSNLVNLIRVIDPDMNFSPIREDKIVLQNDLELYETDISTGVFEKTFSSPYGQLPIVYEDKTVADGISQIISYPAETNQIDPPSLELDAGPEDTSIEKSAQKIPDWVKNVFIWYGSGEVTEAELLNSIKFLITEGIIKLD